MMELEQFYQAAQRDEAVAADGGKSRIFRVVRHPVERLEFGLRGEAFNRLLKESTGYEFYDVTSSGRVREFAPDSTGGDRRFLERLDDLTYDIAKLLTSRRSAEESPRSAPVASAVYLAETTPDLELQRDNVRRELQVRGYEVLPQKRLPPEAEALREAGEGAPRRH